MSSQILEIRAVVVISPWGNQPPYNSWDAAGLAGIHIPMLVIAGDQDDVSDYAHGIKPAFEEAVHSDRCMLVYQNARHNVGGNPAPPEALGSFATREYFEEPVWRKDRLAVINQHFITAFLDLTLKGARASELTFMLLRRCRTTANGRLCRGNPPGPNSAMERITGKVFNGVGQLGWKCTVLRQCIECFRGSFQRKSPFGHCPFGPP